MEIDRCLVMLCFTAAVHWMHCTSEWLMHYSLQGVVSESLYPCSLKNPLIPSSFPSNLHLAHE